MNAIKLYISVARLILENESYDQAICKEISNSLPHLEQSLTCTVCRNILRDPYSPVDTVCQHHVCETCVGGRKRLKPSCSWCKDYTKYVRNTQLQCLLACYKALCSYIKHSNLLNQLSTIPASADTNRSVSVIVQNGTELSLRIKKESCDDDDDDADEDDEYNGHQERYSNHLRRENSNVQNNYIYGNSSSESSSNEISRVRIKQEPSRLSPIETDESTNSIDTKPDTHSLRLRSGSDHASSIANVDKLSDSTSEELPNPKAVYSISFTGTRSKIILKRKHVGRRDMTKDRRFVGKDSNRQLPPLNAIRSFPQQSQVKNVYILVFVCKLMADYNFCHFRGSLYQTRIRDLPK